MGGNAAKLPLQERAPHFVLAGAFGFERPLDPAGSSVASIAANRTSTRRPKASLATRRSIASSVTVVVRILRAG